MNSGDMSDDTRLVMSASYSWMVVCISVDSSMSDVRVLVGGWVDMCVCVVGATLRSRVQASVSRRAWKWSQIWSQDMF